jgi:hypothetical protein
MRGVRTEAKRKALTRRFGRATEILFGACSGEALAQSVGGCLCPPVRPDFRVDVRHVALDGGNAQEQLRGDLLVRPALGQQPEHFRLARGKAIGV